MEAAVIRAGFEESVAIERRHVFPEDAPAGGLSPEAGAAAATATGTPPSPTSLGAGLTFHQATRQFQRQYLVDALDQTAWKIGKTARLIDVHRSYLHRLMAIHGLERAEG
jgi:DNA-binding NtrC family response regulator